MPTVFDFALWVFVLSNVILALCAFVDLPIHYVRGLGLWERISHPLDALFVSLSMLTAFYASKSHSPILFWIYCSLALCTIGLSYKDEFIHLQESPPHEQIVHAVMFTSLGTLMLSGAILILFEKTTSYFFFSLLVAVAGFLLHLILSFIVKAPISTRRIISES